MGNQRFNMFFTSERVMHETDTAPELVGLCGTEGSTHLQRTCNFSSLDVCGRILTNHDFLFGPLCGIFHNISISWPHDESQTRTTKGCSVAFIYIYILENFTK